MKGTRAAVLALALAEVACAGRTKRARSDVDPVEKAMAAEEARATPRRTAPPDELPGLPVVLHVIARSRNVPIVVRAELAALQVGGKLWALRGDELDEVGKAPPPAVAVLPPSPREGLCWSHVGRAPDSAIVAAGVKCKTTVVAAERWASGEARGVLDVLPGVEWKEQSRVVVGPIAARAAGELYIAASYATGAGAAWPYVARWDGEAWRAPPVPMRKPYVGALAPATDGELWITETMGKELAHAAARDAELWHRDANNGWRRVTMPGPRGLEIAPTWVYREAIGTYEETTREGPPAYEPYDVLALDKGDVLVVARWEAGDDEHWAVLRTKPAPASRVGALGNAAPAARGKMVDGRCAGTWLVSLGALPANAPAAFDFLSVRAALAGHREADGALLLETLSGGVRVHGVFLRDPRSAERAAELLGRRTRGKMQLRAECSAPRATRIVPFDIDTGDLPDN